MAQKPRVVHVTPEYYDFIRRLRMDPRVQAGFLQNASITPEQQRAYMAKHAHSFRVVLVGEQPAGYVGAIDGDIRVCVHPDFQKMGLGAVLIRAVVEAFPEVRARIKPQNCASIALFERCGFERAGETSDGLLLYLPRST